VFSLLVGQWILAVRHGTFEHASALSLTPIGIENTLIAPKALHGHGQHLALRRKPDQFSEGASHVT
jgi:hypothetical protein